MCLRESKVLEGLGEGEQGKALIAVAAQRGVVPQGAPARPEGGAGRPTPGEPDEPRGVEVAREPHPLAQA